MNEDFARLLAQVRSCTHCAAHLPNAPNPVVQAAANSRIAIIGQAPGRKVEQTGIPWNDPSGRELRLWLGVDDSDFYNPGLFALMPMGFCYPGKGTSGDLPPRPECAPLWHQRLLAGMPNIQLTLLIGKYAQVHYLGRKEVTSLTDTVRRFETYLPTYFPIIHPSPRNKMWHKRNPWFMDHVVPALRKTVHDIIRNG